MASLNDLEKPSAVMSTEADAVDTLAILQTAIEVKQDELARYQKLIQEESIHYSQLKDQNRQQESQTSQMIRQRLAECDMEIAKRKAGFDRRVGELQAGEVALETLRQQCAPELAKAEEVRQERQRQIALRAEIEQQRSQVQGMLKDANERLGAAMTEQYQAEDMKTKLAQREQELGRKESDFALRQEAVTLKAQDLESREKNLALLREELQPLIQAASQQAQSSVGTQDQEVPHVSE